MKLLLVKTSSLGDVVHALPAVTESLSRIPALTIDWVVEETFAPIVRRHPGVRRVLPIAIRRWRNNWLGSFTDIRAAFTGIREEHYDLILDTQGLLKSALVTRAAHGRRLGFSRDTARESLAAMFYQQSYRVAADQHAVFRQKQIMAEALGYTPDQSIDYGLGRTGSSSNEIVLLHGTTWESKLWPLDHWRLLAGLIAAERYPLLIPAGNDVEYQRAVQILGDFKGEVLDRPPLDVLLDRLAEAAGVVSVDTGLGHLAPAFGRPTVGLFGATDPHLTGIMGDRTEILVSGHLPCIPCRKRHCQYEMPDDSSSIYPPCYAETSPEAVWQALRQRIGNRPTISD